MTMTKEELTQKKKDLLDEIERQKLEAEVKQLEKQTKKPSLAIGVLRAYVKMGKMAANGIGAMANELSTKPPEKEKKKGKSK